MNYRDCFKTLPLGGIIGKEPTYQLEKDIENPQEAKKVLSTMVEPVFYSRIQFVDEGQEISYTDCVEISMLRFLHLIFSDGKRILLDRVKIFMDESQPCRNLLEYLHQHQQIMIKDKDYQKDGILWKERAEWSVFLNKRSFFRYNRFGKYELTACIENVIAFFANFFPKINSKFENDEDKLKEIMKCFSFDFKLRCQYFVRLSNDNEVWFYMENLLKIYMNENNLVEWLVYQYFNKDEGYTRATGHSDYRFSPHAKKLKQSE